MPDKAAGGGATISPTASTRRSRILGSLGVSVIIALVVWLGFRITRGADLSDESYYAVFLDTWLKEGIPASPFLSLHQTAALLLYPLARLFYRISGSTDGLIIFLRTIYATGALLTALSAISLMRRTASGWAAWLTGAMVLTFIPFGLPAPSYNTIGEQALIVALASWGCAVTDDPFQPHKSRMWLVLSAAAWAVATVAYPSILLALALLLVCFFVIHPIRSVSLTYGAFVVSLQVVAWCSVLWILSWPRVRDTLIYQSSMAGSFDLGGKLSLITAIGSSNLGFTAAAASALIVGLLRARLGPVVSSVLLSLLFVAILTTPPALFVRSHDAVFLSALTGLGLLKDLPLGREITKSGVLAVIYLSSLTAGFATAATATFGLFSFPIGGTFAAIIAVLPPADHLRRWWGYLPGALLLGLLFSSSATFYYGEPPLQRSKARERISGSVYAGISASEETAQLVRTARAALQKWSASDQTIVVVGRVPGLYLLTDALPLTLIPFPLTQLAQPSGLEATYRYYADPANRPSIVVIYSDPYFQPINPFGAKFDEWYEIVDEKLVPLGRLTIFRRRSGIR